jgi:glycosyltransferase involved in cell wall biosynthesis
MPEIPEKTDGECKKRIAVVYNFPNSTYMPSFVEQDYKLLSEHFSSDIINFKRLVDAKEIFKSILRSDISVSWFAGGHAFISVMLSRLLRKRSIVVIGGYEVACEPEINYGLFTKPWYKRIPTLISLKYADTVLPVSEFTRRETLRWIQPKKMQVIYNGANAKKFNPGKNDKEQDLVITVAGIDWSTMKRKGLLTFVRSAAFLPDARFVIIGMERDDSAAYLKSIAPSNVTFKGFVSEEKLIEWYQRAKVYVQISAYESFGMSVAEAMLCECVPVVTEKGALPEVVGDTGFYVTYEDEKATARGIKEALGSNKGANARRRIEELFSIKRREKALIESIEALFR